MLIVNDNAFGFVKWEQKDKDFGLDVSHLDCLKYVESFGARGFRVDEGDDLREVLEGAFDLNEVVVIECQIDYSEYNEVFSNELGNMVCRKELQQKS